MTGRRRPRPRQASMKAFFTPAKHKETKQIDVNVGVVEVIERFQPSTEPTPATLTPPSPPVSSEEREIDDSSIPSSLSVPEQPSSSEPRESSSAVDDDCKKFSEGLEKPPHFPLQRKLRAGSSRLAQFTLLGCDLPPSRSFAITTPFQQVSIPPSADPVHSPVTPEQAEQAREQERPDPVPCSGLAGPESRLCRARNLARRAAEKAKEPEVEAIDSDDSSEPPITRPKKRKKALHPFFAATAAAASEAKEKKRPRVVRMACDAWNYTGATVHVNRVNYLGDWSSPLGLGAREGEDESDIPYYLSMRGEIPEETERSSVSVADVGVELWAEKYKLDKRIDVISAAVTKELVDWLRPWYSEDVAPEQSDEESYASWVAEDTLDRERIAIISGGVGCGKSTVVENAARVLGLNILEINASVCRTGRKVRDIVQEALRTHRVAGNSDAGVKKRGVVSAKTLILFEEVDELHEDERGFWNTLQELTASSECRRPIVCTANVFNPDLRMNFAEEKSAARADLERLIVGTKEELVNNPLPYKNIVFTQRTERQTTAVLNRVVATEQIDESKDVVGSVTLLCRNDTRKAVNLLHFWGLKGLANVGKDLKVSEAPIPVVDRRAGKGLRMISGIASSGVTSPLFWTAAEDYTSKMPKSPRRLSRLSKRKSHVERPDSMPTWSETLELKSCADTVLGMISCKTIRNAAEAEETAEVVYYDTDIKFAMDLADELDLAALNHSKGCLILDCSNERLSRTAKDMELSRTTESCALLKNCAMSCRPAFSEYLPTLRSMARSQETTSASTNAVDATSMRDRGVRRTRASMRKGGFSSLDLDPSTVSLLQSSSLLQ